MLVSVKLPSFLTMTINLIVKDLTVFVPRTSYSFDSCCALLLCLLTLSERSCLGCRFCEMADNEAWSSSRIDLLTLSIASSHSFCPGALSL